MALSSITTIAQAIHNELETLDAAGFGSLSTTNKQSIRDNLFTAIATIIRNELVVNMTISVTGTTTQACTAGGAAGTSASTSVTIT